MASSEEESTPKMASSCMNAPRIMVFRPTMEEMKDFSAYISHMESKGAHLAGIAKVIPPKEFVPRKNYDDLDLTIPAPIQQEVLGHQGLYTQYNIQKKAMTVKEFRKLANTPKYCTPPHFDYEDLERKYWKNITYNSPIYGADISGSIYDKGWNIWNINKLGTVLDLIEEEEGVKIEGVNTAYLYFGMWKTTFAWHTEDMDLYSINYIHYGAPKTWYTIPTEHARRLERLASGFFPGSFKDCSSFLRHKMTVIAPYILKKYSIPFDKITQEQGEFMITFPYGYHSGFNHGYNIAESTNFASIRWIDFGKRATSCVCTRDSVKIQMDPFVRVFQPERYQTWIEGREVIYLPAVDGPNPPTVSQKPKPPLTGSDKPVLEKQVHRRHPVHKKGIIGEVVGRKRPRVKKEKAAPDDTSKTQQVKEKLDKGKEKLDKKKSKPTERKRKKQDDAATIVSMELALETAEMTKEERRNLKRRLKRLKEKSKAKKEGSEFTDKTMYSELAKATKSEPVVTKEKDIQGTTTGRKKKDPGAGGDTKKETRVPENGERVGESGPGGVHSYSKHQASAASKRKSRKPKKRKDATVTEASTGDSEAGTSSTEGKVEHTMPSPMKYTLRGATFIPTRTNTDGTQAASNTGPKGAKELSRLKNDWVRSMNGLWSLQPPQFVIEQVHNLSLADQKPGCCVCMLFYNNKTDNNGDDEPSTSLSHPNDEEDAGTSSSDHRTSRVLCPEMCFACSSENPTPLLHNPALDSQGRSRILSCVSCKIGVHAACYGEDAAAITGDWKCSRCKDEDWQSISCCLCHLRGGALKPTTTDQWAHIVCAMAISEVSFVSVRERGPIDVTHICSQRLKLKCYYCRSFIKCSPKYAACIQCSVGKCALSFHVTCAKAAGTYMEPSDWPFPVYATCIKHPFAGLVHTHRAGLPEISTGAKVIAKHKNKRFYEAEVIGELEQMFCHVNFHDNSFSENLFPEDIESHNIQQDGSPDAGTRVKVRWTDGLLYDAIYQKNSFVKIYDIEFQDGSVVTVKRDNIYAEGEQLPKKVRTKMSVASAMRHEDFYVSEVIDDKHRQVLSVYAKPSVEEGKQPGENGQSEDEPTSDGSDSEAQVAAKEEEEDE